MRSIRPGSFAGSALSVALLAMTAALAAAQGTVTGTITSQAGVPLQESRVIAVGTSVFATTGPDGKYILRRVPAGTAEIRVNAVGYQERKKSVKVLDGQTATLDFVMTTTAVQLQEIIP